MRNRVLTTEEREILKRCRDRLGECLRALYDQNKLSTDAASLRAGLDNKTLRRIERGESSPTFETLILLSVSFDLPPSEFLRQLANALDGLKREQDRICLGKVPLGDGKQMLEIWRCDPGE